MTPDTKSGQEYILFNAWEDIVTDTVREQMRAADMCRCDKCFKDVCAIVLNQIPCKYVTSQAGALFTKLPAASAESRADLLVLVTRALGIVGRGPKH